MFSYMGDKAQSPDRFCAYTHFIDQCDVALTMNRVMHTHYDNLRIKRNATPGIIKAAYRALSHEYHPDRNPDRDTTRIMQILNDAYAVLSDSGARAKYDAKVAAEETAAVHDGQAEGEAARPRQASDATPARQGKEREGAAIQAKRANARATRTVYVLIGTLVLLFFAILVALALA